MTRNRLIGVPVILVLMALAGCQQRCFMTEGDFKHYNHLALNGTEGCVEPGDLEPPVHQITSVTTVNSPEAAKRYITLAECIALALENGRVGNFFDREGQQSRIRVSGLQQRSSIQLTDSIRVFAYDPAIIALDMEQSLSKFDARLQSSIVWNKTDRPVSTALESFQSGFFGPNFIERDDAAFQTQLLKPLPTGGLAGITFSTDYEFSNLAARVNPNYRPALEFSFEQPLLRGFGVAINQLREAHPGSIRTRIPGGTGGRVPGILLTRNAFEQAQVEFEGQIHDLLAGVEEAYWNLYCAYWTLYSRETAMRQAHIAWHIAKIRYDAGRISIEELAQIEEQFHRFRVERLRALGQGGVLEAERFLRYVTGLPPEDGTRLIPSDVPTVAAVQPDWSVAIAEAMVRRPELIQSRLEIQRAQLALLREKNELLPELAFFATYDVNAVGSHLDGKDENSALRNLAEGRFDNWTLGLLFEMPIGFREAHTEVTRAKLQLARTVVFLRDVESKITFALQRGYRRLEEEYKAIEFTRARRLSAATQLEARYERFKAGRETVDLLLEAQGRWADALRDEHIAICDYNKALAEFERLKGTIMDYDNVYIAEGPLPSCAQKRASAHIRERSRSIVLKEPECGSCDGTHQAVSGVTEPCLPIASGEPAPIPVLLEKNPAPPDALEKLPPVVERTRSTAAEPPQLLPASQTTVAPVPQK